MVGLGQHTSISFAQGWVFTWNIWNGGGEVGSMHLQVLLNNGFLPTNIFLWSLNVIFKKFF